MHFARCPCAGHAGSVTTTQPAAGAGSDAVGRADPGTAAAARARRSPRRVPPGVLVLGGVVSVQVGAAVAKRLFPVLGPDGTVALRLLTGAVVLWAVVAAAGRRPARLRAAVRELHPRLTLAFGAVLAAMNLSFYGAIARVPLGVAVALEFLGPLALALAGARRLRDLAAAVAAAAAVLLLTGGGAAITSGRLDGVGLALAVLAGAFWACYILLSGRVGAAAPGLAGLAAAVSVGGLLVAPLAVAHDGARLVEPHLLLPGVAVGVLSCAVPFAFELVALRSLRASTFAVLMSLEPAVAAVAGLALLGEHLTPADVAGVGLVCLASVAVTVSGSGQRTPSPDR